GMVHANANPREVAHGVLLFGPLQLDMDRSLIRLQTVVEFFDRCPRFRAHLGWRSCRGGGSRLWRLLLLNRASVLSMSATERCGDCTNEDVRTLHELCLTTPEFLAGCGALVALRDFRRAHHRIPTWPFTESMSFFESQPTPSLKTISTFSMSAI